jgi:hypothetical protein
MPVIDTLVYNRICVKSDPFWDKKSKSVIVTLKAKLEEQFLIK